MGEPRISVVIPTCDRPQYLHDAVDSVFAQTSPADEILVIDNGREPLPPGTFTYAEGLRLVRALPRFGVSQARNLGAILASGDYIAFLDDDDGWDVGYLADVRLTIRKSGAEVVLGRLRDRFSGQPIKGKQALFRDRNDLMAQIMRRNPGAGGSNTVVERRAFTATAGYDPWITTGQDKALILDLLIAGIYPVRSDNGWIDFRNDQESQRQTDIDKRIQGKARFLRKYWGQMGWNNRLFNLAQLVRLYANRFQGTHRRKRDNG